MSSILNNIKDRREYVKYIGGAVVGAVIVGAYSAMNPSTVETTVTQTKTEQAAAGAAQTVTQTVTKTEQAAAPKTEIKNPGNIIYQYTDPITHGDPPLIWAAGVGGINYHVYDRLFIFGASSSPKAWLVDSYEKNAAGTEWTFTLKSGIKFHSGNPLEAKDVKWSLDRAAFHKHPASGILHPMFNPERGDSIEVVNDLTFKIKTKVPAFSLIYAFAQDGTAIIDSETVKPHVPADGETAGKALQWLMENEAGSGPWLVESEDVGVKTVFVRWDDYWAGPAKLKRWTHMVVKEPATYTAMLEKGDVDILSRPPHSLIQDIGSKPGIQVIRTGVTAALLNILYDHTHPVIGKKEVRQALSHATPYEEILQGIVFGYGKRAYSFSIDGMVGWIPPTENPYNLNIPKAKELMAKAGYADGVDIGDSTWGSFLPAFGDMAILTQEQWDKLGVKCEHIAMDDGPRWEGYFNHEYSFNWDSWLMGIDGMFTSVPFYFTLDENGEPGPNNFVWWVNQEASDLADKIQATQDLADRNRAITDWHRMAIDDAILGWLYHQEFPFIARDWVTVDFINMAPRPLLPRPYEWGWYKPE